MTTDPSKDLEALIAVRFIVRRVMQDAAVSETFFAPMSQDMAMLAPLRRKLAHAWEHLDFMIDRLQQDGGEPGPLAPAPPPPWPL